jgi:hypothetical protein
MAATYKKTTVLTALQQNLGHDQIQTVLKTLNNTNRNHAHKYLQTTILTALQQNLGSKQIQAVLKTLDNIQKKKKTGVKNWKPPS